MQWTLRFLVSLGYRFWLPFCEHSLTICQRLLLPSSGRSTHREPAIGRGGDVGEASRGLVVPISQLGEPMGRTFPEAHWWASWWGAQPIKICIPLMPPRVLFAILPASFHFKSCSPQLSTWDGEERIGSLCQCLRQQMLTHTLLSLPHRKNHKPGRSHLNLGCVALEEGWCS